MISQAEIRRILEIARRFDAVARWDDFMQTCKRCDGKGYHHGFGEDGHDPDWCIDCGGPGYVINDAKVEDARAAWVAEQLQTGVFE